MRVLIYTHTEFADCTFPLVKEMQQQGVDVYCYLSILRGFRADNIIEFDRKRNWFGFYKASKLHDFDKYANCLDLNKLYIIAPLYMRLRWIPGVLVWLIAILHMIHLKADVIHIDWQLAHAAKMLMWFPIAKKKIMTVHDPIIHGNTLGWQIEDKRRKRCFRWADHIVLLNKVQLKEFCSTYNIGREKISVSHLGAYDSISHFPISKTDTNCRYVLFWGRINPYKGLEYLLEAIKICHQKDKSIKLIVAGSGKEYMDFFPYRSLDYIEWRHRYIGITELVNLIRNCEFAVCPYVDATQSGVVQMAYVLETPVIATNVGALPLSVDDGKTGIIVPPKDVPKLAEAILRLWKDKEHLDAMKKNIKTEWFAKMSWQPIVKQYISIYNEQLSSQSKG